MKGEFGIAVHALVYLNHKRKRESSESIAENVCTNPARIRKVMAQLRRAGLVEAREGAEGGFLFVKEAEQVKKIVTAEMENVAQLRVPLLAEAKVGASWYEAK